MDNKHSSGGIGISTVIQVVLIILKLLGIAPVASWAWSVVLIPLWIDLGITAIALIILLIYLKS
jgi:membrane protein YdbS with pleckstrin-like domain